MNERLSRRSFVKGGTLIAVGLATPGWLSGIAKADVLGFAKGAQPTSDNVLVVCQFSGGNDGLNTVIPYASKAYSTLRPTLGVADKDVLHLDDQIGLHPSLKGLADLYHNNRLAVVQNVGYPHPNRSHFRSMEIWQSASPDSALKDGWIGRHFDLLAKQNPLDSIVALGLSSERNPALIGEHVSIPCFASLADVQNLVGDADFEKMLRAIQGTPGAAGSAQRLIQDSTKTALDSMAILRKNLAGYQNKATYANDAFGNGLKQVAQLIATSPQVRVVYFSVGGFDTHAKQADQHAALLKSFGDAMAAFQSEMDALGKTDKVTTVVFSEFGRRAAENASQGTDHGAAAPMFVIGGKVKAGIHGSAPDLEHLDDGDVAFKTDFREVYSALLDQWMGGDSAAVLGGHFTHAEVLNL